MNKKQCELLSDCEFVYSMKILLRDLPKLSELIDWDTIYESTLPLLTQLVGVMEATHDKEN